MPVIEAELENAKSREQWCTTLTGENVKRDTNGEPITIKAKHYYCKALHPILVADVSTDLVLAVLNPIWTTKHETVSRLRGRIERVLAWTGATGQGRRRRHRPLRQPGSLGRAPGTRAVCKGPDVEHHAAPPYMKMPA